MKNKQRSGRKNITNSIERLSVCTEVRQNSDTRNTNKNTILGTRRIRFRNPRILCNTILRIDSIVAPFQWIDAFNSRGSVRGNTSINWDFFASSSSSSTGKKIGIPENKANREHITNFVFPKIQPNIIVKPSPKITGFFTRTNSNRIHSRSSGKKPDLWSFMLCKLGVSMFWTAVFTSESVFRINETVYNGLDARNCTCSVKKTRIIIFKVPLIIIIAGNGRKSRRKR